MEQDQDDKGWQSLAELTAKLIGEYLHNHHANVTVEALPKLVRDVKEALGPNGRGTLAERTPFAVRSETAPEDDVDRLIAQEAARVAEDSNRHAATEDADWDDAKVLAPTDLEPSVPIGKERSNDFVTCLEPKCGKRFKSLRRHIGTLHGLTPDQYRVRWGLPANYAMVAPNYKAARQELAKQIGLGSKISKVKKAQ